jgi:hypothetical protein
MVGEATHASVMFAYVSLQFITGILLTLHGIL